jgi:1-acyl-sn-glycerol-3-phosphate acyltransferase
MIKANKSKFSRWFWSQFSRWGIFAYFTDIKVFKKPDFVPNRSVLLLPNHFSWWDGFISYRLNDIFFKKSYFVMMEEKNLRLNKILTTAGAFSVEKNSRSLIESLDYSQNVLSNAGNLLVVFPQGQIQALHERNITFQKGAEKLTERAGDKTQVILLQVFAEYFNKPKPTLCVFFETYDAKSGMSLYEAFVKHRKECEEILFKEVSESMRT